MLPSISTILFEFQEGIIGKEKTKVSRTLAEALISSRLHRPRSDPLGASLPSNWNPRERWEKENRRKVPHLIFHIGGAAWIFLRVCKASRKRYPTTVERIFLSIQKPGFCRARKTGNRIQLLSIGILTVRLLFRVEQYLARESSIDRPPRIVLEKKLFELNLEVGGSWSTISIMNQIGKILHTIL